MKICFISKNIYLLAGARNGFNFAGGGEIQFLMLSEALRKRKHDIYFITDDFGQYDEVILNGATYIKVPFRYMGGKKFRILTDWWLLFKKLKEINADIYLMKSPRFNLFVLGMFGRLSKKKCVFVSAIDTDSDPILLRSIDPFYRRVLYRIGLSLIPIVIAQTVQQQRRFIQNFKKRSVVIRNICSIEDHIIPMKKDFVLWVGANNTIKNPELFLELARKTPDIKYKMVMIPSRDFETQKLVERKIAKTKNVEYLGFVPQSEMDKVYAEAALLVNVSSIEGFPNVFLHAWSHRAPVISLNIDPDGVLSDGKIGVCSKDLEQMAKDVEKLMSDDELRRRMGENGYEYVVEEHREEIIASQYLDVFSLRSVS